MKWSIKLGEFWGIGLYMHLTFPLLLLFAAFPAIFYEGDIPGALESVAFIVVLFACVVLHEYGHALTARRYGIRTQDITLLPIGGVARLERMPDKPSQELVVAAAGPLVNVVIAAGLFLVLTLTGAGIAVPLRSAAGLALDGSFLQQLMVINVVLVLFNLIPAFPMDGGRILRALLATRLDYARATLLAARLGQGIAVLFAIAGFFVNPLLIITALFIFMGAQGESQMAVARSKMAGFTAGMAMRTNIRTLSPSDWLSFAVDSMMATSQHDFPVAEAGRIVGILTREELIRGLNQRGAYTPVNAVMTANVTTVEADQPLSSASEMMQANAMSAVPVTNHGTLVGMLTFESIREFLRVQAALRAMRPGRSESVL